MSRHQQTGESLQEFNFKFSELIQAITNYKLKDITDPLKYSCMHRNHLIQQLDPKLSGTCTQPFKKL